MKHFIYLFNNITPLYCFFKIWNFLKNWLLYNFYFVLAAIPAVPCNCFFYFFNTGFLYERIFIRTFLLFIILLLVVHLIFDFVSYLLVLFNFIVNAFRVNI